jgi:hypothetical protein
VLHAPAEAWQWETITAELPCRPDLPTVQQTQSERQRWLQEEEEARAKGDEARMRDCRAKVEQMTRQLRRLESLPPGENFPLQVVLARVGDALWALTPGELYQVFQTTLRERLWPRPVVVSTLTGDWQPGYLPDAVSYGKGIYQDTISPLAAGSLEALIEQVARRLAAMATNE